MKRANFQEPKSEASHSCFSDTNAVAEQAPSVNGGRSKSVAMLGLALSFGASGVLFADSEATAAVGSFSVTTQANSSESPQLPSVLHNHLEQPSVNGQAVYHTVEQGDSLWQIAQEHRVEVQDIKVANRISPDTKLQVGQVIKVPSEELAKPTLVSLLPGTQSDISQQQQVPNLEHLVAGIPNADSTVKNLEQSELSSNTADAPVVVATEELTGDVSLRSAGLVSQSDGFQADLQQLESEGHQVASLRIDTAATLKAESQEAVPEDATTSSLPEESTEASLPGYEVRPGDTVEDIALTLGTTSEELADVNELDNPDFIVAGETLAVPGEKGTDELVLADASDTSANSSSSELTASSSINHLDDTRLTRLQSTVENRINASSTLQRLQRGQSGLIASQAENTTVALDAETESVTVDDPYTASLLAEVNSAQGLQPSLESDRDIALKQPTSITEGAVVNPEFQGDRLEARAISDNQSTQDSELLAAAPLDPSVYVSSPTSAAGQVVSPEMPIMPSADEYLPEAPDYFNGYIWPTRGTLTSGYGWRWGRMHRGIDVAGPVGTPIVSAAAGVVERAGWNSGGYGNLVEVRHADGSMTRYAHNSRITVRPGQRVSQGQHIADMGSTGYSTGPHLHFEVHLPDRGTVNPMAMLPSN